MYHSVLALGTVALLFTGQVSALAAPYEGPIGNPFVE
jgi:hypothetical protein